MGHSGSDKPQRRKFPRDTVVGDGGTEMQRNDREVSFQRGSPVVFLFDLLIFSPELFGECPCALDQRFSFGVPMLQDLFQMKRQKRRFVVIFRVAAPNIFPRPHAVRFKFIGLSSDQPQRRKLPRNAVVGDGGADAVTAFFQVI